MAYTTSGRIARGGCAIFGFAVLGLLALSLRSGTVADQLAYMQSQPISFLWLITAVVACWYAVSRRPIPAVATVLLGSGALLLAAKNLYGLYQLAATSVIPIRRGIWINAWFYVAITALIVVGSLFRLLGSRIDHRREGRSTTEVT